MNSTSCALRIGGLMPFTTQDYPGLLAAVIFCQGCPWRCRYCHNGHLLSDHSDSLLAWSTVEHFLMQRRGLLDGIVFSGGEPTAQSALLDAVALVRDLGFQVGLHTAGPYPQRLQSLAPLLNWVGLDIKALPEDYPAITGCDHSGDAAWDSLQRLLDQGVAVQVHTTPAPHCDSLAYLEQMMTRLLTMGVTHYRIQACQTQSLYDPSIRPLIAPLATALAHSAVGQQFIQFDVI
jgi:pyruvate formate lyase activating enzyme